MKNFRKKGAILVSLLLYLYAGMTMIFSFLAISCRYSASASWETRLLRRENAALQGEAIVRNWFRNSAECGEIAAPSEYTPDEGPLDDPYLEIPDGILSVLNYYEKGVTVEAERLEIPRGAPSELMLSKDGSDPDICVARRYFIRIKVFDRTREDPQLVLAESVIVVCGSAGDLHALTLCTNKQ